MSSHPLFLKGRENMKTSKNGINLIKKFEGCRLKAYKCAAGVWTIGYGHTSGVKSTNAITKEQAERYLIEDLERFEKNVERYRYRYDWNQNEFDALVSFAFNTGSIDKLTADGTRSKEVIAEKILLYNKAGGKVLAGLTERRKAERELFLTKVAPVQPISGTIRAVQQWLNKEYGTKLKDCKACGGDLLIEDGCMGDKTKAALTISLQVWLNIFGVNLKIDGVFGEKTKKACRVVSEKCNANTKGAQIVQAILYCYGYNPQLWDEAWSKDCTTAVKQFQRDRGLEVDGIAGAKFFESALK